MPQNMKEKEKCLDKLNQMQKYLPFIDFMIEKITKKNSKISLEYQLSKFQLLRSMIAEKNGRYSWDVIVKVEDVIEKLISKLDFKDQFKNSKEQLTKTNNQNYKASMTTSVPVISSSSATTCSVTTTTSQATPADLKSPDFSTGTVDLIVEKISADTCAKKSTDKGKHLLSNTLETNQLLDVSGKSMETDLDKALVGFDLANCSNISETEITSGNVESVNVVPEKTSFHDDLLSSSREKLLKSLQSRLFPARTYRTSSQSSVVHEIEETSDSHSTSAFSNSKINVSNRKVESDSSDNTEHNFLDYNNVKDTRIETPKKNVAFGLKGLKSLDLPEKCRTDSGNSLGDVNLKQKLKEKLSTDICEVYRVPGKSVGGSLRSLKESKDQKKNSNVEDESLFKCEKLLGKTLPQCSSISQLKRDNEGVKSRRDSSGNLSEEKRRHHEKSHKYIPTNNDRNDLNSKKQYNKVSKNNESKSYKNDSKDIKTQEKKLNSTSSKEDQQTPLRKIEGKNTELSKLSDDELLEFVKENMQTLPHLSKLKPEELRKAVQSSLFNNVVAIDTDAVSEVSDDSFKDLDDFLCSENATSSGPPRSSKESSYSVTTQVDFDGVTKNIKGVIEPQEDTTLLEIADKTLNAIVSLEENLNEEDYAVKLIEETTPKTYVQKKKGLLELPMPKIDDLFEDISLIESFETSDFTVRRDPRLLKLPVFSESKNKPSHHITEPNLQLNSSLSNHTNAYLPKDNYCSVPQSGLGPLNPPTDNCKFPLNQGPHDMNYHFQSCNKYPSESNDPPPRNSCSYVKHSVNSVGPSYNHPKHHTYLSSEPKSYAEYKRRKLKEQQRLSHSEGIPKENSKSTLIDSSNFTDTSRSPVEKEGNVKYTTKKTPASQHSGYRNSFTKQNTSRNYNSARTCDNKKQWGHSDRVESKSRDDLRERRNLHEEVRKEEDDKSKKDNDGKQRSSESEELISPLEELYRNENKPKTGRGYGLQNFKIPKKIREPVSQVSSMSNKSLSTDICNNPGKKSSGTRISAPQSEVGFVKEIKDHVNKEIKGKETTEVTLIESSKVEESKKSHEYNKCNDVILIDSPVTKENLIKSSEKVEYNMNSTKTDISIIDLKSREIADPSEEITNIIAKDDPKNRVSESVTIPTNIRDVNELKGAAKCDAKTVLNNDKTDALQKIPDLKTIDEESVATANEDKSVTKNSKKSETGIVKCDSSVESSSLNQRNSENESDISKSKSTAVSKEEITQEFVEAIIRKSFQSGEGKLLLTQVKLFEKFARKLNSKKLKTIQKIINSESDSSSLSETSSEDEKKKKKTTVSEEESQKSKKRKKKSRNRKKNKSSSSSSSESEETSEEDNCDKKENKSNSIKNEHFVKLATPENEENKILETPNTEIVGAKSKEPFAAVRRKCKKRRRNMEFGRNFSGTRTKRKQKKKELLEQILNENPEANNDSNTENHGHMTAKETKSKSNKNSKKKVKTELDRLHEDIKRMFISEGVVTATGHRMCRILKQSGGNINNLDIVKESAKMVEEEKLKKVQLRTSLRNSRLANAGSSRNRSRSQSLEKGPKTRENQQENENDPKLTLNPRVCLQRVNLNDFRFGVKLSDHCISFKRTQGRNIAVRGIGSPGSSFSKSDSDNDLMRNVFLARNKRKFKRLKYSKRKKAYIAKKLNDIILNLPLKIAKMKHLKICEKKPIRKRVKKKDKLCENLFKRNVVTKNGVAKIEFKNSELVQYAFEKKRKVYSCKLCTYFTKNITEHYKMVHPEYEVLISRLCLEEAKKAILESERNNFDVTSSAKQNTISASEKQQKMKILPSFSATYSCRMCSNDKITDVNVFASHISTHTGEFRFQCPAEGCTSQLVTREDLKFHILTKHSKSKNEFCSKVTELYSPVIQGASLFGFLCSECHFVQICHNNLKSHISRQHSIKSAKIIKINMSSETSRCLTKKPENSIKSPDGESVCTEVVRIEEGEKEEIDSGSSNELKILDAAVEEKNCAFTEKTVNIDSKEEKESSVNTSPKNEPQNNKISEPDIELPKSKNLFLDKNVEEVNKKSLDIMCDEELDNSLGEEEIDVEENAEEQNLCNVLDMEDCVDLKNISILKGIDILKSAENSQKSESSIKSNSETLKTYGKLKVGVLEAQLLENSEILYECYVKGCLFSTQIFELFEKHIIISHWKSKWNGLCEICSNGQDNKPRRKNALKLLTALKHLKLHVLERCNDGRLSAEDLIMELKLVNSSECIANDDYDDDDDDDDDVDDDDDDEDNDDDDDDDDDAGGGGDTFDINDDSNSNQEFDKFETAAKQISEIKGDYETKKNTEDSEIPYPAKPLLRVRNLLGDRLSTPKADEKEVVAINEEEGSFPESSTKLSTMFTIENVRSLTKTSSEKNEIKIEQVCSLKARLPKIAPKRLKSSGKTIVVRSCPTRKIAIQPEPSALSLDVGHISVAQPPVVGHPLMLSPLSSNSPIRIISTALSPKSKFSVKPILVSADTARLNSPTVLPVIHSALSSTAKSSSNLSATTSSETQCNLLKPLPLENSPLSKPLPVESSLLPKQLPLESNPGGAQSKTSLNVEVISSPSECKSPSTPTSTHNVPKNSSIEEETDEKDTITSQRIPSSPSTGKKSVKGAKIYQEMLTKTKLCHLFKCMGIECSFTCNSESIFTQHIGLHEAQRRLRRTKGMRTIYLKLTNKTTRAFYWQQCAYCCEVLSNNNNALSHHILEEHGHCMYQCAFCFYRAISYSYVEIHQNLAHSQILKTTPRVIYKCKPLRVPPSQAVALEKYGRKQSVRPYHCDQCGRKFFITHEFTSHLESEHQSVTAYTCHICKNLCFKVNRLINHYKLHSYSTYQCAYCLHGTATEKEMVFHLCNFHFSQPAVMYVRALAEGQRDDEKSKPNKTKKHLTNQLDSLKVITYESDTLNLDSIVEVDPEESTEEASKSSIDLSAIVAELGIDTETSSSTIDVIPLMQELASIGIKNLTVKTLLPNAQFSSENESEAENCSVLISSGLSAPSDQNDDREINIPLGQLPLEAVNVQHKETAPPHLLQNSNIESPDKNLKLNEIIVNLQQKDKTLALPSIEDEKPGQPSVVLSSAVHKLPPVVLSRSSLSKNSYPAKSIVVRKKSVERFQNMEISNNGNNEVDKTSGANQKSGSDSKDRTSLEGKIHSAPLCESNLEIVNSTSRRPSLEKDLDSITKKTGEPLITNVVSLSKGEFDMGKPIESVDPSLVRSVSSTLPKTPKDKEVSNSSGIVINIRSKLNCPVLKPPIIRVEDFPIDDDPNPLVTLSKENSSDLEPKNNENSENSDLTEKTKCSRPASPDIIIIEEEKTKDIVTVTLDSDDEKDESLKKKTDLGLTSSKEVPKSKAEDQTIRKEMELLRNQIASETNSLLLDELETKKLARDLALNIQTNKSAGNSSEKTLLSPIEEAICSLNKKLKSETEEAQKKVEGNKEQVELSLKKSDDRESEDSGRPRTRFGARDKRKKVVSEKTEKSDRDDSNVKKEDQERNKNSEELTGKELYICGNEKCDFAADDDASLKDHLYVCDFSRESPVFVCPHCFRQIKHCYPYLGHLRYHGEKKYHCGLCSFASAVDKNVSRHVKQKHKCSLLKCVPKDSKVGHFVYYPKNYKIDKIDFEVNGYSPGDENKLPLQSVYQVNVKCAKCPYFTKVRSNMVRHLKIHLKSVETEGGVVVPSTAPTNPVPCLESKERMFDKMTNLAASSQLAQAKEKTAVESLSPEEEARLPQFVVEQMRYKCCLPDCNYITVDDGMLKHHIKALHDEINYYSCPHCRNTVHVDVRHVTLDKIGYHLKHHDAKLYKCAHCIYFHYQKNVVEKHMVEKHPDKRFFVHIVREPKPEVASEEELCSSDGGARVWKCGLCDEFKTPSKSVLMDHLLKSHNTKSKYKCQLCALKGNNYHTFSNHFSSKHAGEKVSYVRVYYSEKVASNSLESQSGNSSGADSSNEHFDTTPLWQRGAPRIRHIRGILIEEEEIKTKKSKKISLSKNEGETSDTVKINENAFYCPLCTNKKKPFYTRNEDCFRTHLYQELNYQQFACILCGKMFVDRKDFERHHARIHPEKPQSFKQTKEDREILFWVDQVIAKRKKQMQEKKRKLSDAETSGNQGPPKKKKEV